MFSRRKRGHYDQKQYNTGIQTPSASAAAANAFYSRSLGSNAAAEALRRHSLDQGGANAIRDFRPNQQPPMRGSPANRSFVSPRRANSLSGYQGLQGRSPARMSVQQYPQQQQGPRRVPSFGSYAAPRRNSLSGAGGRTNSLTRTTTVVNRDSQGRTLSLTTTTVRQLGGFELVSTKEMPFDGTYLDEDEPIDDLPVPPRTVGHSNPGVAESITSIDSELHGIQEEEEDFDIVEQHKMIAKQEIERERRELANSKPATATPKSALKSSKRAPASASTISNSGNATSAHGVPVPSSPSRAPHAAVAVSTPPQTTAPPVTARDSMIDETLDFSEFTNSNLRSPLKSPNSQRDSYVNEGEVEDVEHNIEAKSDASSEISDATDSEDEGKRDKLLAPPKQDVSKQPKRDASPGRSALKRGSTTPKTKVSFGGTDEAFIYESYDYEDDKPKQSPALAAAARAAPTRSLPVSQAPQNVQKRPSQSSFTNKSALRTNNSQRRQWDSETEFSDAQSSLPGVEVPVRSTDRPMGSSQQYAHYKTQLAQQQNANRAQQQAHLEAQQLAEQQRHILENETAYDANLRDYVASVKQDVASANTPSRLRSLRQAPKNTPTLRGNTKRTGSLLNQQPPVLDKRSSLQSPNASRRLNSLSRADESKYPGLGPSIPSMPIPNQTSLPSSPALGSGGTPNGLAAFGLSSNPPGMGTGNNSTIMGPSGTNRVSSYIPQGAELEPNLSMAQQQQPTDFASAGPGTKNGFRTFSLRGQARPDVSQLQGSPSPTTPGFSKKTLSGSGGGGGGRFKSRFADSDSDDDIGEGRYSGSAGGSGKTGGGVGKVSLSNVFSPNTDVKDLFKPRAVSDSAVYDEPKKKGFFKRMFSKKR